MVVHQKELLEQNIEKLTAVWKEAPIGVYSASMNSKVLAQVTYCTIGSIAKKAHLLGHIDLILADECHLINPREEGMWRTLISDVKRYCPDVRVIGWTGTPFRGDGVWLTAGDTPLFTHIATKVKMKELLELGYLAPLVAGGNSYKVSAEGVAVQNGDYNIKQLAARVDRSDVIERTCNDLVVRAHHRKRWLVFCATIEHSLHVKEALIARGIVTESVSAETPAKEREEIIARFRSGETRALCNVAVLTTGFDVPAVDCIALLRNTRSPVLYVQIAGRGMRVLGADIEESRQNGKADTLWCDYTDTTENLGPVDAVTGRAPRRKKESSGAPMKICDACGNIAPISAQVCPECGADFPIEWVEPHRDQVSTHAILTISKPNIVTHSISNVTYAKHNKPGKPPSLRVEYWSGLRIVIKEYVCLEHDGYARQKSHKWWRYRANAGDPPDTVDEALERMSECRKPSALSVNESGKYPEIVTHIYGAIGNEQSRPEAGDRVEQESFGVA